MLFNSYIFVFLFLPMSLVGYFGLNSIKKYSLAKIFLIGMSFWFYGYFNPSYLVIMCASIGINYFISDIMHKSNNGALRKIILWIGILFNIGILFYFKYHDFFFLNINQAFGTDFTLRHLVLPLGISFFTFQQLSYVIDSYKKDVPKYNFFDYSLFVTFFPQLVAGPIVLHSEIVPQFADKTKKKINADNFAKGLMAFGFGMAKKVLIADSLGRIANWGFDNLAMLNTTSACIVMLSYTLQLYFDFSGYCDTATGIGYMFNIKLPMNFNSPYKAVNILDFWDRWHMTLTRFFKTYVYFPLGGSRKGKFRTYLNVFIVFVVSGIWHGANWTFIVWGMVHGLFSVFTRMFKKYIDKIPKIINWFITFAFVNFAWVIFRAKSLADVEGFYYKIFKEGVGPIPKEMLDAFSLPEVVLLNRLYGDKYPDITLWVLIAFVVLSFFAVVFLKNTNQKIDKFKPTVLGSILTAFLIAYTIVSLSGISTFLYFNF